MGKFWYGAICASVVFVGAYFVFGTQMKANHLNGDTPAVEQPANPTESLSRAPNSESDHEAKLNAFIYNIKTKDDVDKAIGAITEYAKTNPTSTAAQIYKNFVAPIRLFKGMAWRLRFLVEPVDAAYIASISYLRAFKRNSDRRAPHIDYLFAYVTEPNPGENIEGQTGVFKTASELQDYLATKVAATVKKQNEAYKAILTSHGDNNAPLFNFDAGLVLGEDEVKNTASQTMRWRKFMPGHLKGLMANMYERMGLGLYIASYDLEAFQYFMNTLTARSLIAKKGTVDSKTRAGNLVTTVFDVHLQSPKEISELLTSMGRDGNKTAKGKFLTLRPAAKTGQYLNDSLMAIREAVTYRIEAHKDMEVLANKGNQKEYFANAAFLTSRPAITLAALEKRKKLLYSNVPIEFKDRVDNSGFNINISAMFNPNNPYVNDLKKLYPAPNQFAATKETDGGPRETFKWNYDYGTPQAWPDVTFGGVLPNTSSPAEYKKKLVSISRDASTPALTYWLRLFM
jgi:hypothetical protein